VTTGPNRLVVAAFVGALFALGLGVSGMTDPRNVLGFLDLTGGVWNPTLAFVMGGALLIHAPLVRIARGRPRPRFADRFDCPTRSAIDAKLVAGAAVFGVGWGLAGYCPGPALVSAAAGALPAIVFVAAMIAGMAIAGKRPG